MGWKEIKKYIGFDDEEEDQASQLPKGITDKSKVDEDEWEEDIPQENPYEKQIVEPISKAYPKDTPEVQKTQKAAARLKAIKTVKDQLRKK
jgi:hypothetical protein